MLHSLISNHAFVDSNKRTALISTTRFLYINGYSLDLKNEDMFSFVLEIANGNIDLTEISSYLKENSKKL